MENVKDFVSFVVSENDKGVKNVGYSDSKDGIGYDVCEFESCDSFECDKSKFNGYILLSDIMCGDNND